MLLVSNLTKKPEWKDVNVWLRLKHCFCRFFLNPSTMKVDIEKFSFDLFHNNQLLHLYNKFPKSIMLYDVLEQETIHAVTSAPFPILLNTSSRDFKESFKAIWKVRSGGTDRSIHKC